MSINSSSNDNDARIQQASDIVREAGALAKTAFNNRDSLAVSQKGTHDWASNADVEVEQLMRERLAKHFPGEAILGEEEGLRDGERSDTTWVIDPIDGTTCFLFGLPQWCVVLCHVVDARPEVAAIYHPMGDELFTAVRGGGTFVNGQRVHVADTTSVGNGLIAVGASPSTDPSVPTEFMADLVRSGGMFMRVGACALALSYVASGRLLAAYEPYVSPWDDLAGMLLVEEAGGRTNPYSSTIVTETRHPVLAACPGVWGDVERLLPVG